MSPDRASRSGPPVRPAAGRARPAAAATRARVRRRRAGTAALAALALLVVGAALPHASASRLAVRAERAGIVASTACTTTPVDVVPNSSSAPTTVTLDGLTAIDAAACSGAPVAVTLFGASGVLGTAEGTLASAGQAYTLSGAPSPSAVTRVRVLVGGFAVPGAWRVPAPAQGCEVRNADGSVDASWSCALTVEEVYDWHPWLPVGERYLTFQLQATVSHPTSWQLGSGQYVRARATIPETNRPANWETWAGAAVTRVSGGSFLSACSDLPVVEVRKADPWNPVQMDVAYDWDAWQATHPGAVRYCS